MLLYNDTAFAKGTEHIRVDEEGHYGIAYLRLHGLINESLDNMMLLRPSENLNPYDAVGNLTTRAVTLQVSEKRDVMQRKMLLFVILLSRAVQPVYLNIRHTIEEVKTVLFNFGYPNCKKYNIWCVVVG